MNSKIIAKYILLFVLGLSIGLFASCGDSDLQNDPSSSESSGDAIDLSETCATFCDLNADLCNGAPYTEQQQIDCLNGCPPLIEEKCEHGIESTDRVDQCLGQVYQCEAIGPCFDVVDCKLAPPNI